jgi:hypothetical protein
MTTATSSTALDAALVAAEYGYKVLPVCWPNPDSRDLCACPGKHSGRDIGKAPFLAGGYLAATSDTERIERIFSRYPDANVGLWLEGSGLAAVDPDSNAARAEAHKDGLLPCPVRHSKNDAYIYTLPEGAPIERVIHQGGDGKLDILSEGHLVIFGRHVEGHDVWTDWGTPPLPLMPWAVDLLERKARASEETAGDGETGEPTPLTDDEVVEKIKTWTHLDGRAGKLWESGAPEMIGTCPHKPRCEPQRKCPSKPYASESERDLGLMNVIRFWGGKDPDRMKRLFDRSTPGRRPKWLKSRSYRKATTARALTGKADVWSPLGDGPSLDDAICRACNVEPCRCREHEAAPRWQSKVLLTDEDRQAAVRDTFVDRYIAYCRRRTSAPEEFHEAIGLAVLSAAIGRRAVLRLATGDVYPSIWIMELAESSIYHKSTAMDIGRELVGALDQSLLTPNDFTPQRFLAVLAEHDGRPLLFFRDEFSGFYEALNRLEFMSGLKESLCNIYDGRAFRREKQKPKAKKDGTPADESEWKYDIKEPFLSVAVATTPGRFFEVAQTNDLHSGFLPRFAFVVPHDEPDDDLPSRETDAALFNEQQGLIGELRAMRQTVERPTFALRCDQAVFTRFDRYGAELRADALAAPDRTLPLIVGTRSQWMAMRVAILLAVADTSGTVELPHLCRAIEIVERWRQTALRVLGGLAPSKFERKVEHLMGILDRAGTRGMTRRDAMRALRTSKREMDDLQTTLAERGEIIVQQVRTSGPPTFYYISTRPNCHTVPTVTRGFSTPVNGAPGDISHNREEAHRGGREAEASGEKGPGDNCDSVTVDDLDEGEL